MHKIIIIYTVLIIACFAIVEYQITNFIKTYNKSCENINKKFEELDQEINGLKEQQEAKEQS